MGFHKTVGMFLGKSTQSSTNFNLQCGLVLGMITLRHKYQLLNKDLITKVGKRTHPKIFNR